MGLGIKTYLFHKWNELSGVYPPQFEGHYVEWRARRIRAILNHFGADFFDNKNMVELGAGFGAIGAFFAILGSKVTCVEGRIANTRKIRKRYPFVDAITHDLNLGMPCIDTKCDILLHLGVLYHLRNPEESLRLSCKDCEHLILETECSDSDDPYFVSSVSEDARGYDQAIDGVGSRPSPALVERILTSEGMLFERITDARCNSGIHHYDWPIKNTKTASYGQRRMWFVKKNRLA